MKLGQARTTHKRVTTASVSPFLLNEYFYSQHEGVVFVIKIAYKVEAIGVAQLVNVPSASGARNIQQNDLFYLINRKQSFCNTKCEG